MTNGSMTNDQWGNEPMTENGSEWRMKMAAMLERLQATTEKVASGEWRVANNLPRPSDLPNAELPNAV
jgi:hypothetical protein